MRQQTRSDRRVRLVSIGAALLIWGQEVVAAPGCEAVPRVTLALYDSTREGEPRETRMHRYAELVLNHLGQVVVYHNVATQAAPAVDPAEVGLVMSWLDGGAVGMDSIGQWLRGGGFCDDNPRIVAFGSAKPWLDLPPDVAGTAAAAMGIAAQAATVAVGVSATVLETDPAMMDYEANFLVVPGEYDSILASDGQSLLRLDAQGQQVDLAVLGPAGGYVNDTAAFATDARARPAWIVDPFAFFDRVLQQGDPPHPDPTTFQGSRAFLATVSSVGWLDVLPARSFGEAEKLASEVLVERLVEPFADLPMSIAVLAGDFMPELGGPLAERGRQAAMRAFSAAQVEGAVQGFSDIRDWQFFADYDAGREAELLDASKTSDDRNALMASAVQSLRGAFADAGASTFSHTPGAPRKYAAAPFDLDQETGLAIRQVDAVLQADRPVQLYVWSGNARPFEAALAAEEETGVRSMGGGGGVMDAERPSVTGLWPLTAEVGGQRQVYDPLSGDAAYTGYWTSPLHGFHGFGQTLERTENPRRLKPFHLSFAARSALHFETRRAIESFLELARTADVTPVRASAYAAAAEGFVSARIVAEGTDMWRVRDRGALQTVRLDKADDLSLDMARSEGVMGARRKDGHLYVTLDPSVEAPLVALLRDPAPSGIVLGSAIPALSHSRPLIDQWRRSTCSVELQLSGLTEGEVVLVGRPNEVYQVAISEVDEGQRREVPADEAGLIRITVPTAPGGLVGLSVAAGC